MLSDMSIYEALVGQRNKRKQTAANAARHYEHACNRFVSPVLDHISYMRRTQRKECVRSIKRLQISANYLSVCD
jgi:hypothetical protein